VNTTVGALVYPLPPAFTVTEVTPATILVTAVGVLEQVPPVNVTVGAEVYPLPPALE